jgi:hypothetical protein
MAAVSIKARERAAGVRLASVAAGGAGPREWWEHLALSRRTPYPLHYTIKLRCLHIWSQYDIYEWPTHPHL